MKGCPVPCIQSMVWSSEKIWRLFCPCFSVIEGPAGAWSSFQLRYQREEPGCSDKPEPNSTEFLMDAMTLDETGSELTWMGLMKMVREPPSCPPSRRTTTLGGPASRDPRAWFQTYDLLPPSGEKRGGGVMEGTGVSDRQVHHHHHHHDQRRRLHPHPRRTEPTTFTMKKR